MEAPARPLLSRAISYRSAISARNCAMVESACASISLRSRSHVF
jgi:hypothetical protein